MIAPVPETYAGQIIELGAGNGALTLRLAARCPKARILACEINPRLARKHPAQPGPGRHQRPGGSDLRFRRAPALGNGPREEWKSRITSFRAFLWGTCPASGRPRSSMRSAGRLRPGGMYIQFQYSLIDRKRDPLAVRNPAHRSRAAQLPARRRVLRAELRPAAHCRPKRARAVFRSRC